MIYEILDGNTVINTIVADEAFMLGQFPQGNYRAIGEPPAVEPVWAWFIDLGPFYDRFGAAKMAVLTSSDAGIKAILSDLNIRKWVDIKRPDVAQALQYVGTVIPAITLELQSAILNTPVTDHENLALRKSYFS